MTGCCLLGPSQVQSNKNGVVSHAHVNDWAQANYGSVKSFLQWLIIIPPTPVVLERVSLPSVPVAIVIDKLDAWHTHICTWYHNIGSHMSRSDIGSPYQKISISRGCVKRQPIENKPTKSCSPTEKHPMWIHSRRPGLPSGTWVAPKTSDKYGDTDGRKSLKRWPLVALMSAGRLPEPVLYHYSPHPQDQAQSKQMPSLNLDQMPPFGTRL